MPVTPEVFALVTALPTPYLLLSPSFVIEAVSEAYLQATLTRREQLIGQVIFDAFPDNPRTPEANSVHNLRASLEHVLVTGQPHQMAQQHYDVPDPERPGHFVERHWQPLNTPLLDPQGQVLYIIHSAQDITAEVQAQASLYDCEVAEQAAQAEAEQQRERFQEMLLQLPAYVATYHGPDHVYQFVNPPYQRTFPHRSFLGRPFREAMPESEGLGVVALFNQVYQTGEPYYRPELEGWFDFQGNGQPEQFFVNLSLHPLRNTQGEVDGVLDFSYDVTEQVRARQQVDQLNQELSVLNEELQATNEELHANNAALLLSEQTLLTLNQELEARVLERTQALYAQQQQLEQLFMQAPAPIVILDGPQHVYQLVNPAYQHLFPDRALLGKAALEALPELTDSPLVDILQHVYQTGESYVASEMPLYLARREGGPLEYSSWTFVYQPRRNERENVDGILVFAHEVTDQVQARQAIEHNAQQLRLLTDALPVLIAYVDQQQRYQFANEAYRAWFDFDPAALVGQPIGTVMSEQLYAIARPYISRALAGERLDFEAQVLHQDRLRYIQTSYVPELRAGKVAGFYALVHDITEQVLARQQVQQLNEELQVTNQELWHSNAKLKRTNIDLDTFVYAASHDLRSPIVNIVGLLDLLRHQLPPETHDPMLLRLVSMMEESITRFQQTVDHLSTIAHLQNAPEQAKEEIELAHVIDGVRLDLLPLLESTRATLEVDVSACSTVRFSPKDLRSIIFNLVSNAVKYHAPDRLPLVQVRAQCSANQFVLEVQDNGLGLDEKQQGKLFAMFRRLHTHVEGSGVGLYLIKRLIENADGTITVRSQVGVGSTFTVTLPIS